jgi:hypothetical protein
VSKNLNIEHKQQSQFINLGDQPLFKLEKAAVGASQYPGDYFAYFSLAFLPIKMNFFM